VGLGTVIWVGWGIHYLFVLSVNLLVRYFERVLCLTLQRSQNYYHGFLILVCFCCVDNSEKEAGFSPKQAFLKVRADLPFLPLLSQIG